MGTLGIISIVIILANFLVSYKGFNDRNFYSKYNFVVENILLYKEYRRIVTSGFLHINWMHLIFNMLSLYFFSNSLEASIGPVNFLIIYFVGLAGGNLLALFIHRLDAAYSAVGASGAVSAIIFATIALSPGMSIRFFILPISLPAWIYGLAYVIYSIYAIRSRSKNVGHDAHLGGGLAGMLVALIMYPAVFAYNYIPILLIAIPAIAFIYIIITRPGILLVDSFFYNKHKFYSVDHKYNYEKKQKQDELDELLDKINRRGINSLSQTEKERLKELSR
ncbi:rhomboid family intramembrane serine protease [Panacibacter ginsenosidivorans]|uniref:Rhomboid family intramembrane serine protease n=1 Tax=Panacibacter ginsenosidivorans TaxID=1813871 RepID=A0A5B8VBJ7_9BACT|nr:rhomboid family intramembrane serine protease [Panacibacter ginsenosidivorans]QEC68824.1 rhomboid family intramembrane serine protease [Panacibacter ginsenosidivorans]